jgi:hypothetical protein
MPSESASSDAFDRALAETPTCVLDEAGKREQRARYARLARSVTRVRREPEAVLVEFDQGLDIDTLEEALAVERQCCPFFRFAFDEQQRRLRAAVAEPDMAPALDAIAQALEADPRAGPKE